MNNGAGTELNAPVLSGIMETRYCVLPWDVRFVVSSRHPSILDTIRIIHLGAGKHLFTSHMQWCFLP